MSDGPSGVCTYPFRGLSNLFRRRAIHRCGRARVWPRVCQALDLPAIAPGDVLRLARGCPRLTALDYSLDPVDSDDELPPLDKNLSVADQSHVDDLFDLLESRCREANIPPRFQIKLLV